MLHSLRMFKFALGAGAKVISVTKTIENEADYLKHALDFILITRSVPTEKSIMTLGPTLTSQKVGCEAV
jgi:hypothetical protein